jgi:SAM-dependent methyltransferase
VKRRTREVGTNTGPVAAHLGIELSEYDARIRTWIPTYDRMLEVLATTLAGAVPARTPTLVDLGIGTGSVAARCLEAKPGARVIGIDEDEGMLAAARARLGRRPQFIFGSYERVPLPACDAFVASLSLHHLPTRERRLRLFRRCYRALRKGGMLISGDCHPASSRRLQAADRRDWLRHLEETYTPRESRAYLRAWAKEDFYVPLAEEIDLLERAGFTVDIAGRRHSFAVIVGTKLTSHRRSGDQEIRSNYL